MGLEIEAINHVGLVVRDREAAEQFYVGALGFRRDEKRPWWLWINSRSTIHLIHQPALPEDGGSPRLAMQHVALQVPELREVLRVLVAARVRVFQVDFQGNEKVLESADESIDFGVGSLFVRDPEGNLVEFMQLGHGVFAE